MSNNVLNYHQFVLAIQSNAHWYSRTQGRKADADFVRFAHTTRPFIDEIERKFVIAKRESRDRGYIYARLWDEGEFLTPVAELASRYEANFSSVLLKGIEDYVSEKASAAPAVPEVMLSDEYLALCDRVEALNPVAAMYMREEAPKLNSFSAKDKLTVVFNWSSTPQGSDYWADLSRRLAAQPVAPAAPTQPEIIQSKEQDMNKTETVTVTTITYINGVDITKLTPDDLIASIAQCEKEIEDLSKIKVKSFAVAVKIERIEGVITQLVELLDGPVVAAMKAAMKKGKK